tara:strand:- start:664 stop:2022 length:1359 start_codon:yes stop_codon:yes gene_type:complete
VKRVHARQPPADAVVPVRVLASYAAPALPLAAAFLSLQVFVPNLYATVTGYSLTTIGLVLLLARLWDTVTDPLVGYLSDRTPLSWGRRKLMVALGTPFAVLAIQALFMPPADPGLGYLLGWTIVVYAAGTMVIVPMNAWGAELSPDYQQRSRISGARVAYGLAGTLAALVVPAALGFGDARDVDRALEVITWLVVVALVVSVLLALVVVPDRAEVRLPTQPIRAALELLRGPSPLRQLLTAFLLNGIANAVPATLFLMYTTHVLQAPAHAGVLLVAYFGSAIASVPLWVRCSKRFGKHVSWRLGMAIACAFFMWTPFLGSGDVWPYTVIVVATGIATGADLTLPAALQADLIDWDAAQSGYRRPGLFFAIWGTATKLAFALAIGIAFPLLDLIGFDPNGSNTPAHITGLALLYGAAPVMFKLGALYVMRRYPITREAHENIRRTLAAAARSC